MRALLLAGLMLATAIPAHAEDNPYARLDSCVRAGAGDAPRTDLTAAVTSVRALCGAQIKRVREERVRVARRGLKGEAADLAERKAVRRLNDEIVLAVARLTGLQS